MASRADPTESLPTTGADSPAASDAAGTSDAPASDAPTSDSPASDAPTSDSPATSVEAELAFTSYLRVLAIVGVILIHTVGLTYINDDLRRTPVWWVASFVTFSVHWAVPVFVMVSGTLLLRPPTDPSATLFYRKRLSRIGIPLVVWHVVYITLSATIVATVDPRILVARFLRGQSYTGLYFFWLILGLYLVTPLIWPLVATISRRALGVVGALLLATTAANLSALQVIDLLEGGSSPVGEPTLVSLFVPYIGLFLLGYALRDFVVRGTGRVLALAALTAALCLELSWQATGGAVPMFGLENANRLNIFSPVHYQGWLLNACAIAVFVLVRSVVHPQSRWARPRAARLARSFGELALGMFATHLLVLIVLMRVPGHHWPNGASTLPQLAVLCVATVVGATALTFVIKKIPFLRRSV